MDYCVYCGSEIDINDELCPSCGAEVMNRKPASMVMSESDIVEISEDGKAMTGTIILPKTASRDSRYKVLSSFSFMGSMILLLIPVMGQLISLVWALGGCANRNRRNLARAFIYLELLIVGVCIALYFAMQNSNPAALETFIHNLEVLLF